MSKFRFDPRSAEVLRSQKSLVRRVRELERSRKCLSKNFEIFEKKKNLNFFSSPIAKISSPLKKTDQSRRGDALEKNFEFENSKKFETFFSLESWKFRHHLRKPTKLGGVMLSKKCSNSKISENFRISTSSKRLEKVPFTTLFGNATEKLPRKISIRPPVFEQIGFRNRAFF